MINTYLVELIKLLKPEERQELVLYVESPYHNRGSQSRDILALLHCVLSSAPLFDPSQLEKEKVYEQIFPGQPFVNGKLEKLMVELNKLVRTFMLTRQYFEEENEFQRLLDLALLLRKGGQEVRYHQMITQATKLLDNEKVQSLENFYRRFQLAYEIHDWLSLTNHAKGDLYIPEAIHHLDLFFLSCRLDLQNRFLSQQNLTALDPADAVSLDWSDSPLLALYESRIPLIRLTSAINLILSTPQPSVFLFQELLELLILHEQEIEPKIVKRFYTYLRIYCTVLINNGYDHLVPVLHQVHEQNLRRGYFDYEGKISHSAYLNVARIALRSGEVDWANEFIEVYKTKVLGENEEGNFYHLNLATLLFVKKQFQTALDILPLAIAYSDAHLLARRLELKIYYEIDSELLPYKIDAFKMYISRASHKTLPAQIRGLQANFINLLHQLSLSIRGDKARSERLVKRIQEKKLVAERDWLLEKARELGQ